MDKSEQPEINTKKAANPPAGQGEISAPPEQEFSEQLQYVLEYAENIRMRQMGKLRTRHFVFIFMLLACVLIGGGALAWAFLFEYNLNKGVFWLICSVLLCSATYMWSRVPLETYRKQYKVKIMPALGKALGNLKYNQKMGISRAVIQKAGIAPPHKNYHAEDCFTGRYKGVKMLLSEARLSGGNREGLPDFEGVFVMLEIRGQPFKGRVIITSDPALQRRLRHREGLKRMRNQGFEILTNHPDNIKKLASDALFKELAEISALFENAPISLTFFAGKYLFLMIPSPQDLFEPSHLLVPISSHTEIVRLKKEIGKILSIIDILELYER